MKKHFLVFAMAAMMAACNFGEKKVTVKDESGEKTTVTVNTDNVSVSLDDAQAKVEELKKLPPVSNETLKSFFPEEAMGMKRSSFNVSSAMGYAMGTADYRKDDNVDYRVAIYDCAGEAGSAFYSMSYLSRLNMETENDNGYSKTVPFMGTNAIETYTKSNNEHSLHFVSGDRFWVMVEGNEGLDKLKSFAEALGLDKLKGVK